MGSYRCVALVCLAILSNNVINTHPYGYNQQKGGSSASVNHGGSNYQSLGIQPSAAPSHQSHQSGANQNNQQYWWQGSQSPFSAGAAQSSGVRPAGGSVSASAVASSSSNNFAAASNTQHNQFRPQSSPPQAAPTGNFGSAPQGPPAEGLPYAGCAAALKCVAEEFCSLDGTMVNEPVFLSPFEKEYLRVPLMPCLNKDTSQVGFCCRDPLYEDPWPADMPMPGMTKPGMVKPPAPAPVPVRPPAPASVRPPAQFSPPAQQPVRPPTQYNPPAQQPVRPPTQYNPPAQQPVRPPSPPASPPAVYRPPSPSGPVNSPPSGISAVASVSTTSAQVPQLDLSYLPPPGTKPVTRPPAAAPAFQPPQPPVQQPAYRPPAPTQSPTPPRPAPTYFPPTPNVPYQPPAAPAYQPQPSPAYRPPASPAYQPPASPAYQPPASPAYQPPAPQPIRPQTQNQAPVPQGPPAPPFPGCAAALKCVLEEYCSADGTMVNTPVSLTPYEKEYRVPLMPCLNTETNQEGFCCRDPLYNDPWPAGMPMP